MTALLLINIAFPACSDSISTRDCSPVLKEIVAHDITINFVCDLQSEQKIITALRDGGWKKECGYYVPSEWYGHWDGANSTFQVEPGAGDYFADFGFSAMYMKTGTEFDQADEVAVEGADEEAVTEETDLTPSFFEIGRGKKVGDIMIRFLAKYEDGSGIEDGKAPLIERSDGSYSSEMWIVSDLTNAYPEQGEFLPAAYMVCDSNSQIAKDTFAKLCKVIAEKTFISGEQDGYCE